MRWLRPVVSLLLLALLLEFTEISQVFAHLREVPLLNVCFALLLFLVTILLGTFKWRLSLPSARFSMLLRSYLSSLFYFLLPTGVLGAEASKLSISISEKIRLSAVAASITLDKLTGLAALAAIGALAGILSEHPFARLAAPGLSAVALAIMAVIALARSGDRLSGIWAKLGKVGEKAGALVQSIAELNRQPGLVGKNFGLGVLSQLIVVAIYACLARGMGMDFPVPEFIVCVVLANLAAILPVSMAGIGVRELGIVTLLGGLGIDADSATALALSVFAVFLVGSLAGFMVQLLPHPGDRIPR